jgi:hypothetical protein
LCKSASSGKPYLLQSVPLVALVREQRFAPAQAGDAFHALRATTHGDRASATPSMQQALRTGKNQEALRAEKKST